MYMHQNGQKSCALHPMFLEPTLICDLPFMYTHTFAYIYINMLNLKPNTSWPKGQKAKTLSIKPNYHLVLKMANKFISHV